MFIAMFNAILIYLAGSTLTLAVLSVMIAKIGSLMADCPDNGPQARTAALSIATGYAAIGAGGVLLIAGVLPMIPTLPLVAALVGLGLSMLCLGLGFTQAMTTLRDVLSPAPKLSATGIPPVAPKPAGAATA